MIYEEDMLINGKQWYDTESNEIHAHGGCMIEYESFIYWYGENRTNNNFVSCYRTKDFNNWEFCGNVLTSESKCLAVNRTFDLSLKKNRESFGDDTERLGFIRYDINGKIIANIERPKVVYNPQTKKFVMWMHYENGFNYDDARCAIATCDKPNGDFIYHGSFRPLGNESRDCTLHEFNGQMYFIATARENNDLIAYQLTDDYLNVTDKYIVLFPNQRREAPAFFNKNGKVFVLTSGCTGWRPNQCKFSSSSDMTKWEKLKDIGDSITYNSQPAFVFFNKKNNKYYYFGDRWGENSSKYFTSTYVVLEINFTDSEMPQLMYCSKAALPIV